MNQEEMTAMAVVIKKYVSEEITKQVEAQLAEHSLPFVRQVLFLQAEIDRLKAEPRVILKVDAHYPPQVAPVVNNEIRVEAPVVLPTPVNIENRVEAPIVNPTPVNVNVENKMDAPVVNPTPVIIKNDVQPAPVTIEKAAETVYIQAPAVNINPELKVELKQTPHSETFEIYRDEKNRMTGGKKTIKDIEE